MTLNELIKAAQKHKKKYGGEVKVVLFNASEPRIETVTNAIDYDNSAKCWDWFDENLNPTKPDPTAFQII